MRSNKICPSLEEADKIKQIPEEKNNGHEGQDKPIKTKKPRKTRFLACLRKTWVRITGCFRSCISIQEERSAEELPAPSGTEMEELPSPSGTNMEEELPGLNDINMELLPYPSGINMDEELPQPSDMNMEEELQGPSGIKMEDKLLGPSNINTEELPDCSWINMEEELSWSSDINIEEELPDNSGINMEEKLPGPSNRNMDELPDPSRINMEEELQQPSDINMEEELPGHSGVNMENSKDCESSEGKKNEDNKEEDNSLHINEEREGCTSKQMSSNKGCSLEEETPEELYKSIKTSQTESSYDEESSTSDICLKKNEQPGKETLATVPLTLQSFTFHQELGVGTYAQVYLARNTIRKECVAMKVSNKCLFTKNECSFIECDILELSHESPFLIQGLAAFHTEKSVFYVLELATRGDLFDFMCKNHLPLDTPTIQFIIAEVICGTQFLHNKNIIHRDLKPKNILLTADGHIKITDFGIALMGVYEMTKETPRGTLKYMAPELWMKQEYGRGVDYFAIGVILYEMCTSNLPFTGRDATEILQSIFLHTPLYPEFLTPDTVDILQGLLCKYQDYRLGVNGDVKKHEFFSDTNWEDVEARRVEPPAIMTADFVDLNMDQTVCCMEMTNSISPEEQKMFTEFGFVCPDWSQHYHLVNNEAI